MEEREHAYGRRSTYVVGERNSNRKARLETLWRHSQRKEQGYRDSDEDAKDSRRLSRKNTNGIVVQGSVRKNNCA